MSSLFRYFKGFYKQLFLGPLFKLTEAILELFVPVVMASIIDVGIKNSDIPYIIKCGVLMLLLGAVGLCCALICQYSAAVCAHGFGRSLRKDLFRHVFSLSQAECGKFGTDSLITRLTNDVTQVQTGVNMFIRLAVRAPFLTIGSIVMAFTIHPKIALIFLISTPLIILILYLVMHCSLPYYAKIQKHQDRISRLTGENLEGARVIRVFSRQQREEEQFRAAGNGLASAIVRVGMLSAALNPVTLVIVNFAIVAIIWYGGLFAETGGIEQGQIIALVSYMTQTLLALIVLANIIVIFTKAIASARRVSEVLSTQSSMPQPAQEVASNPEKPEICFEHVSFGYPGAGEAALENISFQIGEGRTLGVIGGTGSGKTTAARLLMREYDTDQGSVKLGGADVRSIPQEKLHQMIGIVPQTARLFTGTVRSNLAIGAEDASDEMLWNALKTAQAEDFVRSKPLGLDEPVREGGKNFSGGQKQRLCIARALVCKPEILILDDCTSALDYATDAALRRALRTELQGTTVVMISQRVSAIRQADRILVLDDGVRCGFGTHEALLQNCEVYREICRSQGIFGEADA